MFPCQLRRGFMGWTSPAFTLKFIIVHANGEIIIFIRAWRQSSSTILMAKARGVPTSLVVSRDRRRATFVSLLLLMTPVSIRRGRPVRADWSRPRVRIRTWTRTVMTFMASGYRVSLHSWSMPSTERMTIPWIRSVMRSRTGCPSRDRCRTDQLREWRRDDHPGDLCRDVRRSIQDVDRPGDQCRDIDRSGERCRDLERPEVWFRVVRFGDRCS